MRKLLNQYSHLTAKERDRISFPTRWLLNKGKIQGIVLDHGCGFGRDTDELIQRGINCSKYDPFYFPEEPSQKYDTIICNYVLNVLQPEEQAKVLMQVSSLLQKGGKAYFSVRRDIKYEGFRIHKVHKKPTYQTLVKLPYKSVFRNESCEIYEYQRVTDIQRNEQECPFCNPFEARFICESAIAYAIYDKYPVSEGHALIIPKRHIPDYFELAFREQQALILMLNFVKDAIKSSFQVNDFNVGINIGNVAGQTIPHVHIHLIPRREGDVKLPIGGIRNIFPDKADYTKTK